ncbi:MAG: SRPBCC family protein [Muribaculaceae bacterium]|nr:SRPBCC family protein [Muribaculaceae bacterium]
MSEYRSEVANINYDINLVYSKLSNPEALKSMADMLPAESRAKVQDLKFSADTISVKANPVGEITLQVVERIEPTTVVYSAVSSPVPFKLSLHLDADGIDKCKGYAIIDLDIPVFLKPMVQGPLNQACQKFSELLSVIPYDKI